MTNATLDMLVHGLPPDILDLILNGSTSCEVNHDDWICSNAVSFKSTSFIAPTSGQPSVLTLCTVSDGCSIGRFSTQWRVPSAAARSLGAIRTHTAAIPGCCVLHDRAGHLMLELAVRVQGPTLRTALAIWIAWDRCVEEVREILYLTGVVDIE